ncbi:hypothetical protein [Actinocatenispora rupis]|nr:hypothetical protein [Actinocatenispora rupis]
MGADITGGRMGLAERRAVQRFRDDDYPGWLARIEEAAGFPVPVDVSWDELAVAGHADDYAEFFPLVYFAPLVNALRAVAVDDLGRQALRDGLRTIVVRNTGEYFSAAGMTFADGVLTFDHRSQTNLDFGAERADALRRLLESAL